MTVRRALVLEDDRHMRTLLGALLREFGYEHVACASAKQAQLELRITRYDVGLVDVDLGDESGLDFVRALRCNRAHVNRKLPILIVSGQNNREVIEGARDSGANAFIAKPATTQNIIGRISSLQTRKRPFIDTHAYAGPDRRYGAQPRYAGPERRAAGDAFYV
jgi:two-component system, chemotaxis family, chemotaxis protein CheY